MAPDNGISCRIWAAGIMERDEVGVSALPAGRAHRRFFHVCLRAQAYKVIWTSTVTWPKTQCHDSCGRGGCRAIDKELRTTHGTMYGRVCGELGPPGELARQNRYDTGNHPVTTVLFYSLSRRQVPVQGAAPSQPGNLLRATELFLVIMNTPPPAMSGKRLAAGSFKQCLGMGRQALLLNQPGAQKQVSTARCCCSYTLLVAGPPVA